MEVGHMIPDFRLESTDGRMISPIDFKEKKNLLILFFNPRSSCELEALALIEKRYSEITEENGEVLAIASGPIEETKDCMQAMHAPFPILSDAHAEAMCVYCAVQGEVFVADKYGELKMVEPLCRDTDKMLDKAISTMDLIELECPECGVSTWPAFGV